MHAFNQLFKSANPAAHPDSFLTDINPDLEEIFANALLDVSFKEVKRRALWPKADLGEHATEEKGMHGPESVRFQRMRVGYFCEDKESKPDKLVLNRIVTLKEDPGKA